jgi:hypothetical protein
MLDPYRRLALIASQSFVQNPVAHGLEYLPRFEGEENTPELHVFITKTHFQPIL